MPQPKIRERSFCRYCGALTTYPDRCCAAHRDLLDNDTTDSEPFELEAASATRERGN